MTVIEAARRLGVGRPALSNLLNGKAALSPEMALRLEGTFGADRKKLLELQAAADLVRRSVEDRTVAVGTYAPTFLTIKARQIAEWARNIQARERLPVLLRRLIHATGRELRHVDFPGYDNAQRHGWDGLGGSGRGDTLGAGGQVRMGVRGRPASGCQGGARLPGSLEHGLSGGTGGVRLRVRDAAQLGWQGPLGARARRPSATGRR